MLGHRGRRGGGIGPDGSRVEDQRKLAWLIRVGGVKEEEYDE